MNQVRMPSLRSSCVRLGGPVAIGLVVAACGSSSATKSTLSTPASGASNLAGKSAAQVLAAAQSALTSANGFVATGDLHQGSAIIHLRLVTSSDSRTQIQIKQKQQVAAIIVSPKASYIRANEKYWSAKVGAQASTFAGRWIQVPTSHQLTSSFGEFAPGTLARCLGEDLGKLSLAGTTTVAGQPAEVVRDAGNVPGGAPQTFAIASSGPAYPLRLKATGPTPAGGKVDVCNTGKRTNIEGTLTFGQFNHAPTIAIPKHPLKLNASTGSGSSV